eukprot:1785522-Ditylum_brightwellii.AAC.1
MVGGMSSGLVSAPFKVSLSCGAMIAEEAAYLMSWKNITSLFLSSVTGCRCCFKSTFMLKKKKKKKKFSLVNVSEGVVV